MISLYMAMFLRGKNVHLTYASSGKLREISKKKGFARSSGFEAINSCLPKKDLTSDQLCIIIGIMRYLILIAAVYTTSLANLT